MASLGVAGAHPASVADLDAVARAAGNRIDVAERIGLTVFEVPRPVQVSQISANEFDSHLVVGVRLWGVKFHRPVTRQEFVAQVESIVADVFAAGPEAEEVDVWASVPIAVAKGVVVSGDLAKPTSRTVFSLTVRRGESAAAILSRAHGGRGVFWDETWSRAAFRDSGLLQDARR